MASFREMVSKEIVVAPFALHPMMAQMAMSTGFKALYLSAGGLGFMKVVTEANMSLTEMIQAAVDIRTVCPLPLILDGICGFGDAAHMHRTITMSEAVGIAAIEIEDQVMPKRVHHHIGVEELVPMEIMIGKVKEAVRARKGDIYIIARTSACNTHNVEEAVRRAEAYKKAGADMILAPGKTPEQNRFICERVEGPFMWFVPPVATIKDMPFTKDEMMKMGIRLLVDGLPHVAMHRALKRCYEYMAKGDIDPDLKAAGKEEFGRINDTLNLEFLLEVERRTVMAGQTVKPGH